MKYIICLILASVFAAYIFYGNYFIDTKDKLFGIFIKDGSNKEQLLLENESLRAKILELESLQSKTVKENGIIYKTAYAHLTYPFSHRNLFTINFGSNDGAERYMGVAAAPGILMGQIMEVYPNISIVKSIFDSNFKTAVRIGDYGVDALFEGGNEPVASMVKKGKEIKVSDAVYSASADFPYGMKIGEIKEILNSNKEGVFNKASVGVNYNLNEIREVFVITNYKAPAK
ncbi:MAG: rod shape-determining protein MreC [Candidatus Pacebacteria bacterium]|nr:rod shape-determining protein MreC [Candidatus Paceibacterota bacterium]